MQRGAAGARVAPVVRGHRAPAGCAAQGALRLRVRQGAPRVLRLVTAVAAACAAAASDVAPCRLWCLRLAKSSARVSAVHNCLVLLCMPVRGQLPDMHACAGQPCVPEHARTTRRGSPAARRARGGRRPRRRTPWSALWWCTARSCSTSSSTSRRRPSRAPPSSARSRSAWRSAGTTCCTARRGRPRACAGCGPTPCATARPRAPSP